jgi:N6-L-threonylcarbamoyladenine synthase
MNLLTIETTCDETAAAVVNDRLDVLSSVVASQDKIHERFGGVVPEIASRAHVERILPVIDEALRRARLKLGDLDAVAVANTPGLAGSLLVGLTAAKALCLACDLPLLAVNHLQAHIYACRLSSGVNVFPCIGLVVSGGHSNLYRCQGPTDFTPLGGTIDDAAGEAFDKVASLLGLPYPGGPSIERAARDGDPSKFRFPRPLLDDPERLDFSFSGLKTAVRYTLERQRAGGWETGDGSKVPTTSGQTETSDSPPSPVPSQQPLSPIADIAASFQEAVIDCLVGKAELALQTTGFKTLCVGGGVAANSRFRERLALAARSGQFTLHVPPLALCTDNAVMGAIAIERFRAGLFEDLTLDIGPGPERAASQ